MHKQWRWMLAGLLGAGLLSGGMAAAQAPATAEPDFGDYTSQTLTSRAWDALGQQAGDRALVYVAKCLELYEAQARAMQGGLTSFPNNVPQQETAKYWALNDVGTCLFIRGETLLKQGDRAGAKLAYRKLMDEFGFAQCWDAKGWYWKPAEAAKQKLLELEFDEPAATPPAPAAPPTPAPVP